MLDAQAALLASAAKPVAGELEPLALSRRCQTNGCVNRSTGARGAYAA